MTDKSEDEEINLDEIGWIDEPDGWLLMPETVEEILKRREVIEEINELLFADCPLMRSEDY